MSSTQQLLLGEGAGGGPPVFIEDVFSTYLYTGTGATQTITNNIDLSTKGGLTWIKSISGATGHRLTDTARGATKSLASNSSAAEVTESTGLTAFGTTGFTIGADADYNTSAATYVSWTWRKQPKFFDIVTFTTNGSPNPNTGNISHNLGSTPSCVMVKSTSGAQDWKVYHIGTEGGGFFAINRFLQLNDTGTPQTSTNWINVSSTTISFPGNALDSGVDFVAYLFAHDAGGFGLTGTDNVISCGSFTCDGAGAASISLGYEPQWIMLKRTSSATDWQIIDNFRGLNSDTSGTYVRELEPNINSAETNSFNYSINATGFNLNSVNASDKFIYIACRRGPMKVPTVGTNVYNTLLNTGNSTAKNVTGAGFPPDVLISFTRILNGGNNQSLQSRLRGAGQHLKTAGTPAEVADTASLSSFLMDGVRPGTDGSRIITNTTSRTYSFSLFQRAPSFCDEVCYTGTGVAGTVTHNLAAVPELMIGKSRSNVSDWPVYVSSLGPTNHLLLNNTNTVATGSLFWNSTAPTSSVFSVGTANETNASARTYVFYLFATCAGVSKVGSYTGNGTTQTINCGFTGGARFVMIKRTDAVGGWYVYDTARGMTVMTDPYLFLNSTSDEVATLGSVITVATGFALDSSVLADINVSAGTYIFLAIA